MGFFNVMNIKKIKLAASKKKKLTVRRRVNPSKVKKTLFDWWK